MNVKRDLVRDEETRRDRLARVYMITFCSEPTRWNFGAQVTLREVMYFIESKITRQVVNYLLIH